MTIDEPFEYLTFGGTFGRTFSLWFDRFDFFTSIAGVVLIPFAVLNISVGLLAAIWIVEEEEIPDFHPKHIPTVIFIFGLQFAVYTLATIIGKGAIILGVARMYVGQQVTLMECLRDTWAKKMPLISVSLILGFMMICGTAVLAVFVSLAASFPNPLTIFLAVMVGLIIVSGGGYTYVGLVLANPSIMIENFSGPVQGIKRSWELASGSRCYLLCTLFCLWFLNDMVSRLLHNIFVTGDIMDVVFSIAGLVVSVVPLLIYFPMHAILETVMYLNLRIGRESLNHQVLSGDLINDGTASRFRSDDAGMSGGSGTMTDYRHVPLMDEEDPMGVATELT